MCTDVLCTVVSGFAVPDINKQGTECSVAMLTPQSDSKGFINKKQTS